MANWPSRSTLVAAPDGGVISLWHSTNVFELSPWTTEAAYNEKLFYYFIIPAGFVFSGKKDTFFYNFALKYVKKQRTVTGVIYHNGRRDLQEGLTEEFWSLDPSEPPEVKLMTDDITKLPYLIVPDCGLPDFKEEKRYFIPLPETA